MNQEVIDKRMTSKYRVREAYYLLLNDSKLATSFDVERNWRV